MLDYLLNQKVKNTYSATFFGVSAGESKASLVQRLKAVKSIGLNRVIAGYGSDNMEAARFDDRCFAALDELVKACRELKMTFWLQDYSPFPTGSADGAFQDPENARLNKLFVDERHIDISGPIENAVIRIDALQNVVYGKAAHRFAKVDPACRKRIGIVAYRMQENPDSAASPILEDDTAVLLDACAAGGFLKWTVPDGHWRVFVIFETYESAGRPYFMNLLSQESVELEIKKVHEPVYEHLKDELGKTWNGFFYDEPEIGNAGNANVFDFFMLPGKRSKDLTDCNVYPWSPEMPAQMEKRDQDWVKKLPTLWYDAGLQQGSFRRSYMDAVTALVRDNYNGQVYAFCRDRGIHYIGHVLEEENSHARLGCGPGHYFRQQYHQDEAGIDVIAGQILPGRDKSVSWYGVVNSDGEFNHFGLAKLASSEARINPVKRNRSACETFAMYGQQGLAERKFVIDHLLVNGVNRMLFGELSSDNATSEYAKVLVDYTDRICGLLRNSTPVIKTAVLYHAEAEWTAGDQAQYFQKPGAKLARRQISYEVIPADVFSFPEMYDTQIKDGLSVNGNAYEALIIPACSSLPESVAEFVEYSAKCGYPVFFVDRMPAGICCQDKKDSKVCLTSLEDLTQKVGEVIQTDIKVISPRQEWIRYAHVQSDQADLYLIHNEAPHGISDCEIILNAESEVLAIDPVSGIVMVPAQESAQNGQIRISIQLGQYEMKYLYLVKDQNIQQMESLSDYSPVRIGAEIEHDEEWEVELPDGRIIFNEAGSLPDLEALLGYDFYGKLIYRTTMTCTDKLPRLLDLGAVSDCCEVILNGKEIGKRIASPYLFDIKGLARKGENALTFVVYTSAANIKNDRSIFGIPLDCLTALPYSLVEPMGIRGPVRWLFEQDA